MTTACCTSARRAPGAGRFRVLRIRVQHDGLNVGDVERLPDQAVMPLPDSARPLAEQLRALLAQMPERYAAVTPAYDDAVWVGNRLAEILPLSSAQRQNLLEMNDAGMRLDVIATLMRQ